MEGNAIRYLVIVAPDRPELTHLMQRELPLDDVQIIMDRRQGERRRTMRSDSPERRHVDRRQQWMLQEELRGVGYVVVRQELAPS